MTAYTANRLPRERDAARVSRSSQSAVENTAATAVMSAKYRIQTPAKQMSTKASRKQQNAASIKVNSFTRSFFCPRLYAIGDRRIPLSDGMANAPIIQVVYRYPP